MSISSNMPSIVYQESIQTLCQPLKQIGNISHFILYLIFKNKNKFVISNTTEAFLKEYWDKKLNDHDRSYIFPSSGTSDHYVCEKHLGATPYFKEILEAKFKMFRTYYAIRKCDDCEFILGAVNEYPIENQEMYYRETIPKLENFSIDFIDHTIEIIKKYCSNQRNSIILNNDYYRKMVIRQKLRKKEILTRREIECLFWAAQGKSSQETAILLNTSKATIEIYRKNIREKLNCTNMAHAVFIGIKHGYLNF